MYRLSVAEQQHQEFLAKFLQSRVWHGWNGSNPASGINWDSQEMMALINETLLGSSALVSGLPVGGATPSDGDLLLNGLYGGEGGNGTAAALPFGGDYFMAFNRAYFSVHGYLAIVISIFGIVSNVINIAVLSQKSMVTPTNAILTALALVDVLVMLTYVPFALHQFILRSMLTITQWRSYSWMVFICFNINFTIVCHTISGIFFLFKLNKATTDSLVLFDNFTKETSHVINRSNFFLSTFKKQENHQKLCLVFQEFQKH